jgi:hypothetical protein
MGEYAEVDLVFAILIVELEVSCVVVHQIGVYPEQ